MRPKVARATFKKKVVEQAAIWFWGVLLLVLGSVLTCIISIKNKLIQHACYDEASFWLLLITLTLLLIGIPAVYWRYVRLREAYGVFWNKDLKMRCLECRKPLTCSTGEANIFHCARCDKKYPLRDVDGAKLTEEEARNRLRRRG